MKRLTTEQFIEKARKVHGNKYDYSLVEYKGNRYKVKIICPEHGEFWQKAQNHMRGLGCEKCASEARKNKKFLESCRKAHYNKYDYSLVKYNNAHEKIDIICPKHGIFRQKAQNHMKGQGCPHCAGKIVSTEDFIQKSKEIHGDKYDYLLVEYKRNRDEVKIICPKHGIFTQKANSHTSGYGCPICNESKGERRIRLFLQSNNISFERQKTFSNLKNEVGRRYFYDFFIPKWNTLIEYDGEQHFMEVEHWGGKQGFENRKERDKIKNEYAKRNNISLLRIPYWDLSNIEKTLQSYLSYTLDK
jgi:very-short-patch-repair endonuclease